MLELINCKRKSSGCNVQALYEALNFQTMNIAFLFIVYIYNYCMICHFFISLRVCMSIIWARLMYQGPIFDLYKSSFNFNRDSNLMDLVSMCLKAQG